MSRLRHPPLLWWSLIASTLALVLVAVVAAGTLAPPRGGPPAAVTEDHSTDAVISLGNQLPGLLLLSDTPDERLHDWADNTEELAATAAEQRRHAGADDRLTRRLDDVADAAQDLRALDLPAVGEDASDTLTRDSDAAVRELLTAIDAVTAAWNVERATGSADPSPVPDPS